MSDKTTIPVPVITMVRRLLQAEVNWDHLENGLLDVGIDLNDTYAPNVFELVVEIVFGPEDGKCHDWIYEAWADKVANSNSPIDSFINDVVKPHLLAERRITVDD